MTDLVGLVMDAAATELLYAQAAQIDQEVQRLLAEMERAPARRCRSDLAQRFLDLLERRGQIAQRAPVIFEAPRLQQPRTPEPVV